MKRLCVSNTHSSRARCCAGGNERTAPIRASRRICTSSISLSFCHCLPVSLLLSRHHRLASSSNCYLCIPLCDSWLCISLSGLVILSASPLCYLCYWCFFVFSIQCIKFDTSLIGFILKKPVYVSLESLIFCLNCCSSYHHYSSLLYSPFLCLFLFLRANVISHNCDMNHQRNSLRFFG